MISTSFSKKLSMSEIIVEHAHQKNSHVFDATAGKINSSFGYIVKGTCELHPIGKTIELPQGAVFFCPDGVRYRSVWTGTPDIEQYCIHIVSGKYDVVSDEFYPLQMIEPLSTPEYGEMFREIYRLFSTGIRADKLEGLSLYYGFYAKALPLLRVEKKTSCSPVVAAAIAYIEENYSRDFNTADIAEACHISESRLYHLFSSELGISPTKYRNEIRIEKAARELRRGTNQIETIAFENGFNSLSYFYEVFKTHTGMTPTEYCDSHR